VQVESKGNRRTIAEHDASLHDLIIESQPNTEYNESEDNSSMELNLDIPLLSKIYIIIFYKCNSGTKFMMMSDIY